MSDNTVLIDGFSVGTDVPFEYDERYLERRFDQFNRRYFGGELPHVNMNVVSVKAGYLGRCRVKATVYKYGSTRIVKDILWMGINMNQFYERNEKTVCSTLLHEMIHVYEYSVLHRMAGHERNFLRKMNEINSGTEWGVSTTETVEEINARGSAPSSVLDNLRNNCYLLVSDRGSDLLAFIVKKNNIGSFDWMFERYPTKVYNIYDGNDFASLPIGNKKVHGLSFTEEIMKSLLDSGKIGVENIDIKGIRSSIDDNEAQRIRSNCYLGVIPIGEFCYVFLFSKKNLADFKIDIAYHKGEIYGIKDGSPFVGYTVCRKTIRYRKVPKEDIDRMKYEGKIYPYPYSLSEKKDMSSGTRMKESSLESRLESDPFVEVLDIKDADEDSVMVDMTII